MPKKEDKELLNGIIGLYFHTLTEDRHVQHQGRIIGKEGDFYIVQLFDWVIGADSAIQTAEQSGFLATGRINLYRTPEEMNDWYKYKAPKSYQ